MPKIKDENIYIYYNNNNVAEIIIIQEHKIK